MFGTTYGIPGFPAAISPIREPVRERTVAETVLALSDIENRIQALRNVIAVMNPVSMAGAAPFLATHDVRRAAEIAAVSPHAAAAIAQYNPALAVRVAAIEPLAAAHIAAFLPQLALEIAPLVAQVNPVSAAEIVARVPQAASLIAAFNPAVAAHVASVASSILGAHPYVGLNPVVLAPQFGLRSIETLPGVHGFGAPFGNFIPSITGMPASTIPSFRGIAPTPIPTGLLNPVDVVGRAPSLP